MTIPDQFPGQGRAPKASALLRFISLLLFAFLVLTLTAAMVFVMFQVVETDASHFDRKLQQPYRAPRP
jgi:hypothetical protein